MLYKIKQSKSKVHYLELYTVDISTRKLCSRVLLLLSKIQSKVKISQTFSSLVGWSTVTWSMACGPWSRSKQKWSLCARMETLCSKQLLYKGTNVSLNIFKRIIPEIHHLLVLTLVFQLKCIVCKTRLIKFQNFFQNMII